MLAHCLISPAHQPWISAKNARPRAEWKTPFSSAALGTTNSQYYTVGRSAVPVSAVYSTRTVAYLPTLSFQRSREFTGILQRLALCLLLFTFPERGDLSLCRLASADHPSKSRLVCIIPLSQIAHRPNRIQTIFSPEVLEKLLLCACRRNRKKNPLALLPITFFFFVL